MVFDANAVWLPSHCPRHFVLVIVCRSAFVKKIIAVVLRRKLTKDNERFRLGGVFEFELTAKEEMCFKLFFFLTSNIRKCGARISRDACVFRSLK